MVLLVATSSWRLHGREHAFRTTAIVVIAMLIPLGLFIWNRYSLGHWETVDASAPKDRPALYTAAFVLLIPIGIYFCLRDRSAEMVRGLAAVAILIGILAGLNRWTKLSVHVALATFATVIILRIAPALGVALLDLPAPSCVVKIGPFTSFACRSCRRIPSRVSHRDGDDLDVIRNSLRLSAIRRANDRHEIEHEGSG